MSYDSPFAGLKVVDLSQGVAGPYCGMLLAQYGADVVKVEPARGDWSRTLGKRYGDQSTFSVAANLGKRSIVLDIKTEAGQEIVRRLVKGADVFIEGFRPGVTRRLGFGYEDVSRANPRILYLSVSGFGQTGPLAERPAVDAVLQAYTGLTAINKGADGIPHRVIPVVTDMSTGLYAFQALAVALYARQHEARGRYIEASLMQSAANLQAIALMAGWLEGGTPQRGRTPSGVFKTGDGWLHIGLLRDSEYAPFCDALDAPALRDDPRFATNDLRHRNEAAFNAALTAALSTHGAEYWSERLLKARILHQKVQDYVEFLKQPQVEAAGIVAWLDQPNIPGRVPVPNAPGLPRHAPGSPRSRAPGLGEHTEAVLAEIGYGAAETADLARRGVVNR